MTIEPFEFWEMKSKIRRAIVSQSYTKVIEYCYHFLCLVVYEKSPEREKKTESVKQLFSEVDRHVYVRALKKIFRLANINANHILTDFIIAEFDSLNPDDAIRKEFMSAVSAFPFYRDKIKKFELCAAKFPRSVNQRETADIEREIKHLSELTQLIGVQKEMMSAKREALAPIHSPHYPGSPVQPIKKKGSRVQKVLKAVQSMTVSIALERELDDKLEHYNKRIVLLQRTIERRQNNQVLEEEREKREAAFTVSRKVANSFEEVLNAIPGKALGFFGASERGRFDHEKFIDNLLIINHEVVDADDNANDKNAALMQALLYLFREKSSVRLKKILENLNHPMFKNFFFAFDFYSEFNESNALNVVKLGDFKNLDGEKSDGTEEQRPLIELQTLTSFFIEAFYLVLEERRIQAVNHFNCNPVVSQKGVHPENQSFIFSYVMKKTNAQMLENAIQPDQLDVASSTVSGNNSCIALRRK